jgi:hypothetical protein
MNRAGWTEREGGGTTAPATVRTAEELVRSQLSDALGGRRGVVEAIVPTLGFTLTWTLTHWLELAVGVGVAGAVVVLGVRLVQRSTIRYGLYAIAGMTFAAVLALTSGDAEDAFLPGILYNGGYFVLLAFSALVRWPVVGFLVGSVTGDPTGWHTNRQVVRLCTTLTWLLALPCLLRFLVQYPLWAAGETTWLGIAKLALGWPVQLAALAAMAYVLARNHTPIDDSGVTGDPGDEPSGVGDRRDERGT